MVSGPDSTLDCADVCASTASRFGSPAAAPAAVCAWPILPEYEASPGGLDDDIRLGLGGTIGPVFLPVAGGEGARNGRV